MTCPPNLQRWMRMRPPPTDESISPAPSDERDEEAARGGGLESRSLIADPDAKKERAASASSASKWPLQSACVIIVVLVFIVLYSSSSSSSSQGGSSPPPSGDQQSLSAILSKAAHRALGGGIGGAIAGVCQVLTLMWLRTAMNYQYRHGGRLLDVLRHLHGQGGVARFYQGVWFALLQVRSVCANWPPPRKEVAKGAINMEEGHHRAGE